MEAAVKNRYVFSLNGEDFSGSFESRDQAELAAVTAARRSANGPATFFVARAVSGDPAASGHAQAVLANMKARARHSGCTAGGQYLSNLTSRQTADLDATLENAILGWLEKHHLQPACFDVEAISEHTVPTPAPSNHVYQNHVFTKLDEVEVSDLGSD